MIKKQNRRMRFLAIGFFVAGMFLGSSDAKAVTYYVDKNSKDGQCSDNYTETSLASPWCSINKANSTLSHGDTVYIREGTYADQIRPVRSGIAESPITYVRYQNETVNVKHSGEYQIYMGMHASDALNYIVIDGFNFNDSPNKWFTVRYSQHITIQNCTFRGAGTNSTFSGSQYFTFRGNTVTATVCNGYQTPGSGSCPTDSIQAWDWDNGIPGPYRALIENNTFKEASHYSLGMNGSDQSIVRNNIFQNKWHGGLGVAAFTSIEKRNLIEGNTFKDNGIACAENPRVDGSCLPNATPDASGNYCWWCGGGESGNGGDTMACHRCMPYEDQMSYQMTNGHNVIFRRNLIYNSGSGLSGGAYNHNSGYFKYYNNTIDQVGRGLQIGKDGEYYVDGYKLRNNAISRTSVDGVKIYGSITNLSMSHTNWYDTSNESYGTNNTFNLPGFIDWGSARNYHLQDNSPLINAGTWLTTTRSATNNDRTIYLNDASWFTDGWTIITGDTISLEDVSGTRTITAIDYANNTITVDYPITIAADKGVAEGTVIGSTPDIGAYEYDNGGAVAPSGLVVR